MEKIMVAEDDQTMVTLLTTLLKMDGFEVVALDADEDIPAAVERDCPDILLLDVHLTNQNGFEVLDALHEKDFACNHARGYDLGTECKRGMPAAWSR